MQWLNEAAKCLAEALPAESQMIVFGSQARGDARPDSDIDLLVIEPEAADRHAEMVRLSTLLRQHLIPADVVVMSVEAFYCQKTITNTLAWRAAVEGKFYEFAH